ncbi:MAG: hypothetical protein V4631_22135 [Pseudomonadota bacterium]
MQFPRLMFRTPGPDQCLGGTYANQLVRNAEEFEARQSEGWHPTLPEALAPTPAPTAAPTQAPTSAPTAAPTDAPTAAPVTLTTQEQTAPPTYDEMKAKATELGLEYPGNISKAALLAMITAKLAEQV